jgi:NAD(P)H-dependent FMN reductase
MIKIGVILTGIRPNHNGDQVDKGVHEAAPSRSAAEFELIDLQDHTGGWADKIAPASFDGFVMVIPDYNHSVSGVLKNALDYLTGAWNNKAVGVVSDGGVGGPRAAEQLWLICGALQVADVSHQVRLSLLTEFENHPC